MNIRTSETFRNASFISIMLVLSIHYGDLTTPEITHGSINYFIQDFVQNGLARAAVPLFSLISGYLLSYKTTTYETLIKKRFITLFIPYVISSLFALACYFALHRSEHYSALGVVKDIFITPMNGQLWFIRDLMVIAVISPAIFLLSKFTRIYSLMLSIVFILWALELQPFPIIGWYLINLDVLFFFLIGFASHKYISEIRFSDNICKRILFITLPAWLAFTFARCISYPEFDLWYVNEYTTSSLILQKASIAFGVMSLLCVCYSFKVNLPKSITSVSFFVFLFHNYPFVPLSRAIFSPLGEYRFYVTAPLFACLFVISGIALRKVFPKVYGIISGGR